MARRLRRFPAVNDTHEGSTDYAQLFVNNRAWVADRLAVDPDFFDRLAHGQTPRYLFIGCSDSRVNANEITGTGTGEMFIHRNLANVVVHTDMNLMSVLQFAIEVLQVEHVIVCGHFGCGGVQAAMAKRQHGMIDNWLRNIKDVYRLHRQEVDQITDPVKRHDRMVELNVREQVYRLCSTTYVQRAWRDERKLHVHGWVYDIRDGLLRDLAIDPDLDFDSRDIYDYEDF